MFVYCKAIVVASLDKELKRNVAKGLNIYVYV